MRTPSARCCSAYLLRPRRPLHVACADHLRRLAAAAPCRVAPCAACPLAEICKGEGASYGLPAVVRAGRGARRPATAALYRSAPSDRHGASA
jgi:hypothetical protein